MNQNRRCNQVRNKINRGRGAARRLVNSRRHNLNTANSILSGTQRKVGIAQRSLQIASNLLNRVRQSNVVGTKCSSAIAKFGLDKIFSVRQAGFNNVPVTTASTGRLTVSMIVKALENPVKFASVINLRDVTSFSKRLGDRVVPGLSKYIT